MFITKKHLSRRTVLRGMGVSLALPFLDSMVPAQTPLRKTAAAPRAAWRASRWCMARRAARSTASNKHYWSPEKEGARFRIHPDPEAARAVSRLPDDRQRHRSASGAARWRRRRRRATISGPAPCF